MFSLWTDYVPSWISSLITTVSSLCIMVASAVAVLLYKYQNKLLYHPVLPNMHRDSSRNPPRMRNPAEWGMPYEDVEVVSDDGIRLHCWLIKQQDSKSRPTILFFQENAGNMGMRLPSIYHLWNSLQANIFMVSYRGYGRSEGEPEEKGIKKDAEAVLLYLFGHKDVDGKRIILLGRSLGGAVAVHVASRFPDKVRGLILENTFTSISDMVDVVLPWVAPLKGLVLRIGWRSLELIVGVACPILFICGMKDELVPPAHMERLYQAARMSKGRRWYAVEDGTHNDTCMRQPGAYCREVASWIADMRL